MPSDPVMLLSFLNLKLRDFYTSLDVLCEDLDISDDERKSIVNKISSIGYQYDKSKNQFV